MNKNTVRLFVLAMTFAGLSATAQKIARPIKTDNIAESLLVTKYQKAIEKRVKEYDSAVKLAKINNWPLRIQKTDGGLSTLVKVNEYGTPIYITTTNAGSAITSRANYLQPDGDSGLNLTGQFEDDSQILIGVWDGGYPLSSHLSFGGRTAQYDFGDIGVQFHPTHVTGTIIGGVTSNAQAKGLAQKATVASFDYDGDYGEMVAYAGDLILSNHSYGYDPTKIPNAQLVQIRGAYIDESREVDDVMFDNPYYQPVFAAGNAGKFDYMRITDRATAKNAIVVAAVEQVNNYTDPSDVIAATFTSWGPTKDHRIKPDISAKGVNVISASNTGINKYDSSDGTSMACPGVTGALALVQQYYANLHTPAGSVVKTYMKSATVRALVAHTADEAGLSEGPDPIYGWGLLNVKKAAEVLQAASANTTASVEELVLTPGQTYTKQVTALGGEPLIATIAWTDPAGAVTTVTNAVLVNNLDIKVTKGAEVNYPWKLNSAGEYAERGENNVDNIEKVQVDNPAGTYTITVTHKKSTLQNPNGSAQQAYSLIISGRQNTLGLEDSVVKMFSLWPNPAGEQLNITFAGSVEKNATAVIYDAQGRQVLYSALLNSDNVLNVQGLAKGIYMVTVTNGEKTEVEKVIIK